MGSVIFSAAVIVVMTSYAGSKNGIVEMCKPESDTYSASLYNAIIAICLSFYIIIALFSIVYTGRMLSKPGISNNIKRLFLKKHISYVVGFIAIWIVTLASAYRNLYLLNTEERFDENSEMLLSQGYRKTFTMLPNGIVGQVWINDREKVVTMEVNQIVSLMATISTGLLMAFIRCFEPYFIFV